MRHELGHDIVRAVTLSGRPATTRSPDDDSGARAWVPTLTGTDALRALAVVEGIADDLVTYETAHPAALDDAGSLASGRAGLALFHLYRYRATGNTDARAEATEMLAAAIDDAAAVPGGYGLGGGLAGVGFAIAHAARYLGADPDDLLGGTDGTLLRLAESRPWQGPFDLVDGLVGLGVYGLERLPSPAGARLVAVTTARLAEQAEYHREGITWSTPPRLLPQPSARVTPFGRHDLGVARGVAGVIGFLARASLAGIDVPARALLEGAVAWLHSQPKAGPDTAGACFPAWTAPGTEPAGPARTAWCNGDPGVAAALSVAARALDREDMLAAALGLARDAARRPLEGTGVVDGGLCHGAGGLGVVFARLHAASGDPVLRAVARSWFRHTLDLARPGMGFGGYSAWRYTHEATGGWENEPGLLEGAAGVGLALLAAATPVDPAWDRLLLLSGKPEDRSVASIARDDEQAGEGHRT
ncbi:MAG TPA: lanthionine synthetase C family protein [Acidimicrobiia bacterium]|nr:lanthionine synthetase C family protein [Acidimicrobiia bacterium]